MKTEKYNRYITHRQFMRTGDTIQWQSHTALGFLIRLFSNSTVNHSSPVIRITEYDFDRVFILEALNHGIEMNILSSRLKKFDGKVFWMPLHPKYDKYRQAIGRHMLSELGKKYDYLNIFRQIYRRASINSRRLFCSEYDFYTKQKAGIPEIQNATVAPRPGDLEKDYAFLYMAKIKIF